MMFAARQAMRGFTLIEAALAMALIGFGLLSLAGTQIKLSQSTDVARQRSEATRMAQQKMESLRSYTSIVASSGVNAWNSMVAGSDMAGTNTRYDRSWTIAGSVGDPMRWVSVAVRWTDRAGSSQQVTLNSVISKTDPADVGALGFPLPANTTLKRPKNRNLNIPVPALDLGNGQSLVQLQSNFAIVFSNDSGYVVKTCGFVVTSAADLTGCTTTNAYIIAGYISLSGTSSFPTGLGINTGLLTGSTGTSCSISDALDPATGSAISGFKYYLCVISVAAAGSPWSGQVRLAGMANGTDYLVCRFQYPQAVGVSANQRNVQPYANVAESLDTQNYVIATASSCPTVSALTTTLHQNCRSGNPGNNPNRSADCPAS